MAKKYNGTISFASALRPTGAQPLDDRMVVQSLTDLLSASTFEANGASAAYNGMMVAVLEEQKVFMLVNAANLSNEDSWVSVGSGNGSLSVETLDEAKALATIDNRGQIIFVVSENATYVVTGAATVMKLAASTAESIDEVVAALQSRVKVVEDAIGAEATDETEATGLYKEIKDLKDSVAAIEVPVKDVTFNGESVLGEEGVAAITVDLTPYETVEEANKVRERMGAAEGAIEGLDAAVKAIVIPEVPVQDVTVNGASVLGEGGVAAIELPDFATFETVEEANKVRERMGAAEGAITALQGKDTELAAAIDGKVAKEDGKRLMTDAEGTKLAGVADGAQVNVIEVVKVNGTALTVAAADKSVDVIVPTAPVQGVAEGEKVLALDGDKLKTTLTLAYVPATETENAVLRLQGINGEVVSSIDATAFVKDGMLSGAKLEGPKGSETGEKYLSLTFNTDGGSEEIRLNVWDLIDYYAAGNGLALDGKTFSVKLDETANSYLQVTTNGLAVSQTLLDKVTELDNAVLDAAKTDATTKAGAAETAAKGYTDTTIAALKLDETYEKVGVAQGLINDLDLPNTYEAKGAADTALASAQGYTDEAIANLNLDTTYEKAGVAQGLINDLNLDTTYEKAGVAAELLSAHEEAMVETLAGKANVGDSYLKAEADDKFVAKEGFNAFAEEMEAKLEGIEENAEVNVIEAVKVNGIEATVTSKVAEVTVDGTKVALGKDIMANDTVVYASTKNISDVLQGIQDSVAVAVSGGLTGVVGGNGIEVSAVSANKQTVSVKVSSAEGNMITADENGIYAAMYFDGDDVEDEE